MLGRRQALQAVNHTIAASSTEEEIEFTVDRGMHVIHELWFQCGGSANVLADAEIKIYAEGEFLFSGRSMLIRAITQKTDQAVVDSQATEDNSPRVLGFALPLRLSKDYPIRIVVKGTANDVIRVSTHGELVPEDK